MLAFKCFLIDSGVKEFAHVDEAHLREAMPILASLGRVLMAHAELPGPVTRAVAELDPGADPRCHATWLRTRPPEAEEQAITLLVALARETGARVHIVHVGGRGPSDLRRARAEVFRHAETCHTISCSTPKPSRRRDALQVCAPIRERSTVRHSGPRFSVATST